MVSWIASAELQGDEQASFLSLVVFKRSLSEVLSAGSPVSAAAEDAGRFAGSKPCYLCLA